MSKISKSIVISEFLWLLFFAVVFLKFDYTRTTLAVVNAIVWLCAAARCQQAERKRQHNNWQSFHKSVPPFGHIIIFHFVRINLSNIIIPCKARTFQLLSPYKCVIFL